MRGFERRRGVLVLAFVALVIAGTATVARAHGDDQPSTPVRSLVSMRLDNSQTFETVAVETNGAAEVGVFIGETTGTHYWSVRLSSARLTELRAEIATADGLPHNVYLGRTSSSLPFVNTLQYLINTGRRSFDTSSGHVPLKLNGLVTDLSGLITRYEQAATTSTRTKPRFGQY